MAKNRIGFGSDLVLNNSNIGIGTTDPKSKLDVVGNARISGILTVGSSLFVVGNVSIGGTLTYEDVVNVDAIGVITARNGIRVTSGGLTVTSGISTFGSDIELDAGIRDINNTVGSSGSILVSTGAGVSWTTPYAASSQGTQGLQGTQGTQGLQGTQGTQGTQGLQGTQGTQGAQGLQGTQGTQGVGSQGSQGTQGTEGAQGSQGTQGTKGIQGAQGLQGTQGIQGLSNQGTQGTQGIQGLSNQGTQGTQGLQGLSNQGTQGIQGSASASGGGGGSGKFDTSIDNVIYFTPTGTLDRVGVGTTTTQLTTLPSTAGTKYLVHSIHVTNISNGNAEITASFDIDSRKVLSTYSSGGGAGIHTCRVSSASTIMIGMGVTGTNVDYNTLVTDVSGTMVVLSKPLTGTPSGTLTFIPGSKVISRLPVPVGSAVELLKQPFVLYASDSIRVQATGVGTGGQAATTTASASSGAATLTVASATNIASGQLVGGTGIATNTYVGVGYTPSSTLVPITRATTAALSSSTVTFTDLIVPQDGALHTTIVYQSTTDTAYQNDTSAGVGVGTTATVYYGTGNTYPSVIQTIRVANISDSGDYPVWVGIGNSDTVFNWLAYNMVIPKNSSIELCEAPKILGIGQSIFAYSDTVNSIEIQIAGKQKTT